MSTVIQHVCAIHFQAFTRGRTPGNLPTAKRPRLEDTATSKADAVAAQRGLKTKIKIKVSSANAAGLCLEKAGMY